MELFFLLQQSCMRRFGKLRLPCGATASADYHAAVRLTPVPSVRGKRPYRSLRASDHPHHPTCSHHAHNGGHIADGADGLSLAASLDDELIEAVVFVWGG